VLDSRIGVNKEDWWEASGGDVAVGEIGNA